MDKREREKERERENQNTPAVLKPALVPWPCLKRIKYYGCSLASSYSVT